MNETVKDYPSYLGYPKPRKKQTNADRIRAMTDEELAHVLRCLPKQIPPYGENCIDYNCYLCTVYWLKQEVKDNDN